MPKWLIPIGPSLLLKWKHLSDFCICGAAWPRKNFNLTCSGQMTWDRIHVGIRWRDSAFVRSKSLFASINMLLVDKAWKWTNFVWFHMFFTALWKTVKTQRNRWRSVNNYFQRNQDVVFFTICQINLINWVLHFKFWIEKKVLCEHRNLTFKKMKSECKAWELMLSWFWWRRTFQKRTMSQPTAFSRPLNWLKNVQTNEHLLLELFDNASENYQSTKSNNSMESFLSVRKNDSSYLPSKTKQSSLPCINFATGNLIGKFDEEEVEDLREIVVYYKLTTERNTALLIAKMKYCSIQYADSSRLKMDPGVRSIRSSVTSLICLLSMLGLSLNLWLAPTLHGEDLFWNSHNNSQSLASNSWSRSEGWQIKLFWRYMGKVWVAVWSFPLSFRVFWACQRSWYASWHVFLVHQLGLRTNLRSFAISSHFSLSRVPVRSVTNFLSCSLSGMSLVSFLFCS